jgi:hypothetical protein
MAKFRPNPAARRRAPSLPIPASDDRRPNQPLPPTLVAFVRRIRAVFASFYPLDVPACPLCFLRSITSRIPFLARQAPTIKRGCNSTLNIPARMFERAGMVQNNLVRSALHPSAANLPIQVTLVSSLYSVWPMLLRNFRWAVSLE